jgi:hypothetical protein
VVEDGRNGLLVDPARPETLRAALERLLGDPALARRFRDEGLSRSAQFSRTGTFSEVEAALGRVAGLPSPSAAGAG